MLAALNVYFSFTGMFGSNRGQLGSLPATDNTAQNRIQSGLQQNNHHTRTHNTQGII